MRNFEESWLANNRFPPFIWLRYVDDTLSLFESKDTASRFQQQTSQHQFQHETGREPRDPILGCLMSSVITTDFQLLYTIKRLSLVFTPSGTPRNYKVNLIRTLTYRCLRIYSKSTLLQSTLSDLKNSLLQNAYPRGVINYNVNGVLHKHKDRPSQPALTERCNPCFTLFRSP